MSSLQTLLGVCVFILLTVYSVECKNVLKVSSERNKNESHVRASKFQLAKHFQSNMVLQRAPSRASIYGFSDALEEKVFITMITSDHKVYIYETAVVLGPGPLAGVWSITMDPIDANVTVQILVIPPKGVQTVTLDNVIFGDVWLCSGQSNMEFNVKMMFNASEEIANAHKYPNIRLMAVELNLSAIPLYDVIGFRENWTLPSNESVSPFSAVCWLYGRYIYEATGIPMGMISSEWGGTPVEAWSSPDALKKCNVTNNEQIRPSEKDETLGDNADVDGPTENSVLWNAMIHPFLPMSIYGAIWYQGEKDSFTPLKRNRYNCTFPAMIDDWRGKFHNASGGQTKPVFPFGFVQLAPNQNASKKATGFPDIRWHQTADVGYVPNVKMPNVFMAVALDLPDFKSPYGSIHPRDKLDVGQRLSYSGLTIAYNITQAFQGPFPEKGSLVSGQFVLDYGTKWTLDIRNDNQFEFLCSKAGSNSTWVPTTIVSKSTTTVTLFYKVCQEGYTPTRLRYNWRVSPCAFKTCAVYSTANELPAPPFVVEIQPNVSGVSSAMFTGYGH